MPETYRVRIEKERLVFSAAHFITYDGDTCEPLHGHNYHVAAEVSGPLDENCYVVDFIALRDELQAIVDALDHRMLLPTEHRTIRVAAGEREIEVTHGERRWVFPRQDCVLLPMANTTAELLARHIGQQLQQRLLTRLGHCPRHLQVAVDECDGQWGVCELLGDDRTGGDAPPEQAL
ncbi:MAG: 6-pyruvoyl tetrahydrobiopterin synthase [Planctomycetaceae bacterium]|nr:6-pyruvoyl tetrahydrobiopterin synthase [Planctomycetaceae bacterium]